MIVPDDCPFCKYDQLEVFDDAFRCPRCGAEVNDGGGSYNPVLLEKLGDGEAN